jgi:hypothetical protein
MSRDFRTTRLRKSRGPSISWDFWTTWLRKSRGLSISRDFRTMTPRKSDFRTTWLRKSRSLKNRRGIFGGWLFKNPAVSQYHGIFGHLDSQYRGIFRLGRLRKFRGLKQLSLDFWRMTLRSKLKIQDSPLVLYLPPTIMNIGNKFGRNERQNDKDSQCSIRGRWSHDRIHSVRSRSQKLRANPSGYKVQVQIKDCGINVKIVRGTSSISYDLQACHTPYT